MTYVARAHLAASAIVPSSDYNQGMDNEAYLKSEHDLATPAALNSGWRQDGNTWAYVSASIFGISGFSASTLYQKGTRIRWKDGGTFKYAATACSSGSQFAFTGGADYSAASAVITDNYYSYELSPCGYPDHFAYAASVVGFTGALSSCQISFHVEGERCTLTFYVGGTSNATNLTITTPLRAGSTAGRHWYVPLGTTYDAGAYAALGSVELLASGSIASVYKSAQAGWTNSGGKVAFASLVYEF